MDRKSGINPIRLLLNQRILGGEFLGKRLNNVNNEELARMLALQEYKNMVRIHENMVAHYTHILAIKLGIDPQKPLLAAMYHDHGKFLWDEVLFTASPKELTDELWKVIKEHPKKAGEVIFKEIPMEKPLFVRGDPSVIDLIELHHEKPDGKGYYGRKDIPIEAVIISIADIFDACLSDRPYRDSLPIDVATEESLKHFRTYLKKRGYDPKEVEECLRKSALKVKKEHKQS